MDGRIHPRYNFLLPAVWHRRYRLAAKVSSLYAAGKYEEAEAASKNAGKWTKIGFFAGIVVIILYTLIYGATLLSLLNS